VRQLLSRSHEQCEVGYLRFSLVAMILARPDQTRLVIRADNIGCLIFRLHVVEYDRPANMYETYGPFNLI